MGAEAQNWIRRQLLVVQPETIATPFLGFAKLPYGCAATEAAAAIYFFLEKL